MSAFAATIRRNGLFRSALEVVQLGRPKFLLGGVALYGLGALAASVAGFAFDERAFWWGQLAITTIQLMTHYSNDYFDYWADLANPHPTRWSGGSRVLVRGALPRRTALWVALSMAALALVATATLYVLGHGSLTMATLGGMLVLAWSYSSPPLRLHTRGLGEPAVVLIVPILTPFSGFIVQTGRFDWLPVGLSLPLAPLLASMLLTLEFPDEAGDRTVGKTSWVVLFGARRVAQLCVFLLLLALFADIAVVSLGVPSRVAAAWLCLAPVALVQLVRLLRNDWRRPEAWSKLEFGAVALFFLAVLVDLVALASLL